MKKLFYIVFFIFPVLSYSEEFQQYCVSSLANGSFFKTDCSIKSEFGGKEYCFGNKNSQSIFVEEPTDMINRAISFYNKTISIPMYTGLNKKDVEHISKQINNFFH